jgi:hypothetical protein
MPCPESADLVALVQGEAPPREARAFREHLEDCYRCREEAREIEDVLVGLQARRERQPGPDLVPALLSRIAPERARRSHFAARWIAAAALVLIAAGGALLLILDPVRPGPADPRLLSTSAVEWLERAQEPSGGFSAARWGGRSEHDVGLTGLAALALLPHAGAREASTRAMDFLLSSQSAEGRFGPDVREGTYNHAIATVALLASIERGGGERLREPVSRALAHVRRTQRPGGGWGYEGGDADGPNTAATCWPLQALLRARALGWTGLDGSIENGFRYFSRVADRTGRLGYRRPGELAGDSLSSMGALCALLARDDFSFPPVLRGRLLDHVARAMAGRPGHELYRDFFIASVAGALPAEARERWRSDVCEALAHLQVRDGPERGSWEPRDAWGAAGGRVYATALGALILDAPAAGRRS